jgi:hypothetical protein
MKINKLSIKSKTKSIKQEDFFYENDNIIFYNYDKEYV